MGSVLPPCPPYVLGDTEEQRTCFIQWSLRSEPHKPFFSTYSFPGALAALPRKAKGTPGTALPPSPPPPPGLAPPAPQHCPPPAPSLPLRHSRISPPAEATGLPCRFPFSTAQRGAFIHFFQQLQQGSTCSTPRAPLAVPPPAACSASLLSCTAVGCSIPACQQQPSCQVGRPRGPAQSSMLGSVVQARLSPH